MRMRLFAGVPIARRELFEIVGRLDAIAQDGLAGVDVAGKHRLDGLPDERFTEGRVRGGQFSPSAFVLVVEGHNEKRLSH